MKKLAIIGGSNTTIKDGYAGIIKQKLGEQCDIFAIGSTTPIWAIITILEHNIIGNYEYVLFQFTGTEIQAIDNHALDKFIIIAELVYILNLFGNSKSMPIFIIFPYYKIQNLLQSSSYIYHAVSKIFNFKIINLESEFIYMDYNIFAPDGFHLVPKYQDYVATKVLNSLNNLQPANKIDVSEIKFTLFDMNINTNLDSFIKGTSLITRDTYLLLKNSKIILPNDKFLSGIIVWIDQILPYIAFKTKNYTLIKNLNSVGFTHIFNVRTIGWSIPHLCPGGELFISNVNDGGIYEDTHLSGEATSQSDHIYISAILLCDRPPSLYGRDFYYKYYLYFYNALNILADLNYERFDKERKSFFSRLDGLIPEGRKLFIDILNIRPDLYDFIHKEKDFVAERLLLWAWTSGADEIETLANRKQDILIGIQNLYKETYNKSFIPQYTLLLHTIWIMRDDLQQFDISTPEGQRMVIDWFYRDGFNEYKFDFIQ